MNKRDCPFEAWQLIQAREILQWLTEGKAMSLDKQSFLERIEDTLFNIAYDKLGLKPISKCTIEELQEELDKRLNYEKINIAELLKDCPKGMELDCTVFDNITFDHVNTEQNRIYCKIDNRDTAWFTAKGCINLAPGAKCVIFPKGETTWEGFLPPCKFKDGDIVATDTGHWISITKGGENGRFIPIYCTIEYNGEFKAYFHKEKKLCFDRLATEEEKQKLFQAIKDNGYKWNEETKTLEKLVEPKFKVGDRIKSVISSSYYTIVDIKNDQYFIKSDTEKYPYQVPFSNEINYKLVPNKFDITTLIPFESKVLVRDYDNRMWIPTFWGKRLEDNSNCNYLTTNGCYKYCIPYEDNEYLLGKTDDCDDFYKTWE